MSELNIVLASDDNYIIPTMVTISSILSSARAGVKFCVYILCSGDFSKDGRELICSIKEKYGQAGITFVEIADAEVYSAVTTAHVSLASYYRLYISSLIPVERCLYIDGDMIVKGDLTEIYNTEMDGFYAAGVKDMGVQCHFTVYKNYAEYLGIPDMNTYVNAGFLILNLRKIREDGIDHAMIRSIGLGYKYMDQDIINKLCYGKIKTLPLKYDFFAEYHGSIPEQDLSGYTTKELEDIGQEITVYHFAGGFKPWVCTRLSVNRIWWEEAEKILDADRYRNMLDQAMESERKSDWEYIAGTAMDKEQIVVFGCSQIGLKVVRGLRNCEGVHKIVFADNDTRKTGETVEGIPVLSAKEAYLKYPDALYIISSQNGYKQIGVQLADLGVEEKDMLRYVHKDENYYNRLDTSFIEHEQRQLGYYRQYLKEQCI